ncbi:MAG: methylisocitrate lyase [Planctomycetia bacterium]|nr:methylisocitrate lyase [Planctomycetia bacterium]
MTPSPGKQLREAVAQAPIQVPGAFNALAAMLIEEAGFEAAYLSGAALSAGTLAVPDVGLFTLTELAQQTQYLARSVDIPIIVDADTGFGDVLNVERTVIELESAGAAAIQIEDQQLPKRCGHLSGKTLVEPEQMCAKLKAAANARSDEGLVLIARTDARGVTGLDDAIERSKRYLDAGADWIFPEALESKEEFERFGQAIEAPLVANMTEFGKSPLLTLEELADLGYSAVLYPVTLMRVAMKMVEAALVTMAETGSQKELLDMMQTREELYELLNYRGYEDRDRSYFSGTK